MVKQWPRRWSPRKVTYSGKPCLKVLAQIVAMLTVMAKQQSCVVSPVAGAGPSKTDRLCSCPISTSFREASRCFVVIQIKRSDSWCVCVCSFSCSNIVKRIGKAPSSRQMHPKWTLQLQAARAGVLRLANELAGVEQRLRAQDKLQEDQHPAASSSIIAILIRCIIFWIKHNDIFQYLK